MRPGSAPRNGIGPTVLLLGDASEFGLAVAKAILSADIELHRVVTPSEAALRRRSRRSADRDRGASHLGERIGRALARASHPGVAGELVASADPVPPVVLDPGISREGLREECLGRGVPWDRVDTIRSTEFLASLGPDVDVLFSAAFPLILGRKLLSVPHRGAVNFHPSLLPRCRGAHPIFWTLASGETAGGVTAHFMTPEIDAGAIIAQVPLPLTEDERYTSLYRRAMEAVPALVDRVVRFLQSGTETATPQDPGRATTFREDTPEDRRLRWDELSTREVLNLARTEQAITFARGEALRVLEAGPGRERDRAGRPGSLLDLEGEVAKVATTDGLVELSAVEWRGRRFPAARLLSALGLRQGARLG